MLVSSIRAVISSDRSFTEIRFNDVLSVLHNIEGNTA